MKRTIFIGDIHGCFDEFIKLLEKLNYDETNDNVYLTGDLINKGPKAFELIDFLVQNPQIKSVIGNNEINFLRYLSYIGIDLDLQDSENFKQLVARGFYDKVYDKENYLFKSYLQQFSKEHVDYIKNLSLYIETDNRILLHGGLVPGKSLQEQTVDDITRIRQYNGKPWYSYYDGKKTIIYGHWAADGLSLGLKTKGLDSGCVYGKWLSAYIVTDNIQTGQLIQVSANKAYVSI